MLYYSLIHALDGAVGINRDLYAICTSLLGNNDQNRKESNFINMHTKKENNCKKQKKKNPILNITEMTNGVNFLQMEKHSTNKKRYSTGCNEIGKRSNSTS